MKSIKDFAVAALPTQIGFMAAVLILCFSCCSGRSDYSSVKNGGCWSVEFHPLNTALEESFDLCSGGSIAVEADMISGSISVKIGKENEPPVYEGNSVELKYFEVRIPEDGVYTISLTGKNAEGKIEFKTGDDR